MIKPPNYKDLGYPYQLIYCTNVRAFAALGVNGLNRRVCVFLPSFYKTFYVWNEKWNKR